MIYVTFRITARTYGCIQITHFLYTYYGTHGCIQITHFLYTYYGTLYKITTGLGIQHTQVMLADAVTKLC